MPAPPAITLAVPKGRILAEALPLVVRAGIVPEPALADPQSRALRLATSVPGLGLIRVRSFDAATFVAFGAAELGIVGNDVIAEFGYSELYAPLDLGIGRCRLAVAGPADQPFRLAGMSHIRIATKYPRLTKEWFGRQGVQAECIKLNGAMELAPAMGLAPFIVDLVSTGRTLAENGLVERATLLDVTSRLVVNRAAMKTRDDVRALVSRFAQAATGVAQAA
ncbi:MAG: ATP phosphoribosyltransferase [Sphingomonadaceae bacterium]